MTVRDFEMIETGLGIIEQAAARLGKLALIERYDLVAPFFRLLMRERIAHIGHESLESGPNLLGYFLFEVLPL
jgi:hypothetical protein